jgi:hypothetical protein
LFVPVELAVPARLRRAVVLLCSLVGMASTPAKAAAATMKEVKETMVE